MNTGSPFKRETSKSSFTDDDDLSRMSDLESDYTNNHSSGSNSHGHSHQNTSSMSVSNASIQLQGLTTSSTSSRRMSLSSLPPASPSASSYNKMSVDSDDARSVSSMTSRNNYTSMIVDSNNSNSRRMIASISSPVITSNTSDTTTATPDNSEQQQQQQQTKATTASTDPIVTTPRLIKPIWSQWAALAAEKINTTPADNPSAMVSTTPTNSPITTPTTTTATTTNTNHHAIHPLSTADNPTAARRDPERRSVNRRSSLMPRSKALLRVIDQADEDTHLADLEMRREHDTTQQLKQIDNEIAEHYQGAVPPASWTRVDMPLYQCSRLNPEIEMTSFQLENLTCPSPQQQQQYKSIKRKASEDRFDSFPTPLGLKRRAVSPSLSLNGSPVLTGYNSPPATSLAYFGNSSGNGTNGSNSNSSIHSASSGSSSSPNAAARAQQKASAFNLHEASGGLSRMSLSE